MMVQSQYLMDNQAFKRKQMMKSSVVACSKRGKRKKEDSPYLPKEIIFNILSKLPAEFLHNKGKYVCKTWANIIRDPTFAQTHLIHANANACGFLIEDMGKRCNIRYLEVKEGKIKVTCHKKPHLLEEQILASCEGILLSKSRGQLYVANCVTKQGLKLPCFCSTTCNKSLVYSCSIARIPHTRDFKVILPCVDFDGYGHWHVFTVGTDVSWRKINSGLEEREFGIFMLKPISINGVIYWAYPYPSRTLLAVDLRDESIHYVKVPDEFRIIDKVIRASGFQKMGNYLSCTVRGREKQMEVVNVWILKNIHTSEWVKIRKIECKVGLKVPVWDSWYYTPIAWLDNGRVLLFIDIHKPHTVTSLIAYNLSTGAMRIIKNIDYVNGMSVLVHTKSLVSW